LRPRRSAAVLLATILRVAGVVVSLAGIWAGVAIGRSLEGWSRPLGLAAPGWAVVLGAFTCGLVLPALAVVLDRIQELGSSGGGFADGTKWGGVASLRGRPTGCLVMVGREFDTRPVVLWNWGAGHGWPSGTVDRRAPVQRHRLAGSSRRRSLRPSPVSWRNRLLMSWFARPGSHR
jgi:hypothetical protein